ncbi:MAG: hypothetical protein EOO99_03640 [Pedobacter sp.]|nr:MAG: hypothetical protein EOO99_03640 [Pedobacter sp.]
MIRKDLLSAEIEKLALVLAKIMGLKLEGKLQEAEQIFNQTLKEYFQLDPEILNSFNLDAFESWLANTSLGPEKLDALSEYLFYELGLNPERNAQIAAKLNLLYQELSTKHKIVHLVNFHRQEILKQYL